MSSASAINQSFIPAVIRESVDPEILKRAQSIEWSINRDSGEDEHGYVDVSGKALAHCRPLTSNRREDTKQRTKQSSLKAVDWLDDGRASCDSGLDGTPTSPALGRYSSSASLTQVDEESTSPAALDATVPANLSTGVMKKHPSGKPFPIYKTNQKQLDNDVVFEANGPGERTVHYDRASHVLNEQELDALGLDQNFFGPNSKSTMDEREEETVQTEQLEGGQRQIERLYESMRTDTMGYLDESRSASPFGQQHQFETSEKKTYAYDSVDKIDDDACEEGDGPIQKYMAERVKCTILLMPMEIKLEPKPIQVEMKAPLESPMGEEEKLIENPDLLWMKMGDTNYGPPFGTMGKRKAREEVWIGPPCELCHKQIEERRCMLAENRQFHCWHFSCSFCLKTLRPADFLISENDNKPYCLNCHKREFPEISLVHLNLEAEAGETLSRP